MKLELTPNGELAWAISTLKSVVGHRLADDESITAVEFADRQTTHPFGRLLKSTNDSDKSLWQVQGDVLTEVHRFNEKTRFVISVTEVAHNVE